MFRCIKVVTTLIGRSQQAPRCRHSRGPHQGNDVQEEHQEGAELGDRRGRAAVRSGRGTRLPWSVEATAKKTRSTLSPLRIPSISLISNKATYSISSIIKDGV